MRLRSFASALAFMLIVAGCDKTTDPGTEKPVFLAAPVSVPAFVGSPTDTCGYKAYGFANTVQALVVVANLYVNPQLLTLVNGVWTFSQTADGVNFSITATKQSDGRYQWRVKLNGTDTNDGTVYANWTAMDATATADGKSGSLTIYSADPTPSTTAEITIAWSTAANNLVTYDVQLPQENVRFVLISNGTTGEVTEYMRTNSSSAWIATGYHAVWATSGGVATC